MTSAPPVESTALLSRQRTWWNAGGLSSYCKCRAKQPTGWWSCVLAGSWDSGQISLSSNNSKSNVSPAGGSWSDSAKHLETVQLHSGRVAGISQSGGRITCWSWKHRSSPPLAPDPASISWTRWQRVRPLASVRRGLLAAHSTCYSPPFSSVWCSHSSWAPWAWLETECASLGRCTGWAEYYRPVETPRRMLPPCHSSGSMSWCRHSIIHLPGLRAFHCGT